MHTCVYGWFHDINRIRSVYGYYYMLVTGTCALIHAYIMGNDSYQFEHWSNMVN
jgi:hypothetical protein